MAVIKKNVIKPVTYFRAIYNRKVSYVMKIKREVVTAWYLVRLLQWSIIIFQRNPRKL